MLDAGYLRGNDWAVLEARFPEAYRFLHRRALINEYETLKKDKYRNKWQDNRLAQLTQLMKDTGERL